MTLRVLLTGFTPFPGAPVNPSQELMSMLEDEPFRIVGAEIATRVLPVEYGRVGALLDEIGREVRPDIAVHFGLAAEARGFRLESTARNGSSMFAVDAAGQRPQAGPIYPGPKTLRCALPRTEIAAALKRRGLPVHRSANAGGYLCNYTFYLSRSGRIEGFRPPMSGFVHIPYLDDQLAALPAQKAAKLRSLTRPQLLEGAKIIVEECVRAAGAGASAAA